MESAVLSPWQHDGSRDIIGQALIVALLTLSNQKFWSAVSPTTTTTRRPVRLIAIGCHGAERGLLTSSSRKAFSQGSVFNVMQFDSKP